MSVFRVFTPTGKIILSTALLFCALTTHAQQAEFDMQDVPKLIANRDFQEFEKIVVQQGIDANKALEVATQIRRWTRFSKEPGLNKLVKEHAYDGTSKVQCGQILFDEFTLFYNIEKIGDDLLFNVNSSPESIFSPFCLGEFLEVGNKAKQNSHIQSTVEANNNLYDFYNALANDLKLGIDLPEFSTGLRDFTINKAWRVTSYRLGERFELQGFKMLISNGSSISCKFSVYESNTAGSVLNDFHCE